MILYIFLVGICPLPYVPQWNHHFEQPNLPLSLPANSFRASAHHILFLYPIPHPLLPDLEDRRS